MTTTTNKRASTPEEAIAILTEEIRVLEGRLEKGWQLYDETNDPAKRGRIFDKWLGILHQYEAAYQLRRDLGYSPVAA